MLDESALNWFRSQVEDVASGRLECAEQQLFKTFTRHFIHIHLAETMLSWKAADMYGALYGLFDFMRVRSEDHAKIRVFNPTVEADGWKSPHTVIYLCQRDMPFLVDSLRMGLNRLGLNVYLFESHPAWVRRDEKGKLQAIVKAAPGSNVSAYQKEDFALLQIDHQGEASERAAISAEIEQVLDEVGCCVDDYHPMLKRVGQLVDAYQMNPAVDPEDIEFLTWLRDGNYTFLGIAEFQRIEREGGAVMHELEDNRLGLMKRRGRLEDTAISELSAGFGAFYTSDASLAFTKSSHKSTVHRAVYSDYVIVKQYDDNGVATGEVRLLGLYTSRLYHRSIWDIPLVRKKASWLVQHSRFEPQSHDGKTFVALLEGHPRDELIQTDNQQMLEFALGIWRIYDIRAVRLFMRIDPFEKFASCIIYLPRESLQTDIRERIERRLREALDAEPGEFSTQFLTESVLARIHYVFRISNRSYQQIDSARLEQQIVDLTRDWRAALRETIVAHWGGVHAPAISRVWGSAFQPAYQHEFTLAECTLDLECMLTMSEEQPLGIRFFNESGTGDDIMRLKLFHIGSSLELSDMIPMLENLGFRVLVEHPHQIRPLGENVIWMHDFTLRLVMDIQGALDIDAVKTNFMQAFQAVWRGQAADDGFNRLILGARLDWQSAALFRAYANYLKQLGAPFSVSFVADVLTRHLDITRNLLALFRMKFDPRLRIASGASDAADSRGERVQRLADKIVTALDSVANRNEDELIRQYLALIQATLRSNFFQVLYADEEAPPYLSLKIATQLLEFAPLPRPCFEIYVFSHWFEGVHLRGGKVARGGIRWSDRIEDYRTEVLGLVKAQQVKNAVIVPTGAKGGFIARQAGLAADRDAMLAEGIKSYRMFISGLLDITDNRQGDEITHPDNVVCADDDDPYLVVAADKGTASFSDIANQISAEYGHWLGDAFASGGSNGYDHKGMGITARGAWVAVQRHFREFNLNVQEDSIDVIGIGDMSGDVFGNGMLLSRKIRLLAAFNHLDIFIDPAPDPEQSFLERERLFALPRSGWSDYNAELISSGGGVFSRADKLIPLSPEIRNLLDCQEHQLAPDQLIHRLLQAKVDLIWNGGVGTYVKAEHESDSQVGDRANDSVRVNGSQLRCRVFGEGGNLGLTQLGRMEFSRIGGVCNTDFIDNAAGVDCSDNEVNIKILLESMIRNGSISGQDRNELLRDMTADVADLVLHSNYRQTLAISLAYASKNKQHHDFLRFAQYLEESGQLNRSLEFIPEEDAINDLHSKDRAWTRPELSVLISYAKVELKEALFQEEPHTDPYILSYLYSAFPEKLRSLAGEAIEQHQLANQIIATKLANDIVNRLGFTFVYRKTDSLGLAPAQVAKAFVVVMNLFELDRLWCDIENLDYKIPAALQYELLQHLIEVGRRCCRWYLRNRRELAIQQEIERASSSFATLVEDMLSLHQPEWRALSEQICQNLEEQGVPVLVAQRCAVIDSFFLLPGTVDVALETGRDSMLVTQLSFELTAILQLDWLMQTLIEWQPASRWQDLARESHMDELEYLLRQLTRSLLISCGDDINNGKLQWQESHAQRIARYVGLMGNLRTTTLGDLSVVTVALRELKNLVDASAIESAACSD